jgi:indolepyruvate ferredoxin oxidoreductase beta subunit
MAEFGNPKTRVIVSPRPIYPIWVLSGQAKYPPIEEILGKLEELADRVQVVDVSEDGEALVGTNVLMIGALAASGLLPIPIESFEEAMREILAPKDLEMNFQTFRKGMQAMTGG